jgi:hypothetical protein
MAYFNYGTFCRAQIQSKRWNLLNLLGCVINEKLSTKEPRIIIYINPRNDIFDLSDIRPIIYWRQFILPCLFLSSLNQLLYSTSRGEMTCCRLQQMASILAWYYKHYILMQFVFLFLNTVFLNDEHWGWKLPA